MYIYIYWSIKVLMDRFTDRWSNKILEGIPCCNLGI